MWEQTGYSLAYFASELDLFDLLGYAGKMECAHASLTCTMCSLTVPVFWVSPPPSVGKTAATEGLESGWVAVSTEYKSALTLSTALSERIRGSAIRRKSRIGRIKVREIGKC